MSRKAQELMESKFFKFDRFFQGFGVSFSADAFNTVTFQRAILYLFKRKVIHVSYPLSGDMVILCVG